MSPREQKLLALILIVLAYAACDYFYRAASGFEKDEGLTAQSAEAAAAVSSMTGQLSALPLSDDGRRLLKMANSPLTDDPFEAPSAGMKASAAADLPQMTLSGILAMGSVKIALIGGAQKTGVAAQDSHDLYPLTQCPSGDGTDGGIHTRRIAAGGQDTDFSEFLHNFNLLPPARGGLCIAFAISFFCRPTVMRASTAVPRGAPHAGQRKPKPPG